jgi:hypothetical protein
LHREIKPLLVNLSIIVWENNPTIPIRDEHGTIMAVRDHRTLRDFFKT